MVGEQVPVMQTPVPPSGSGQGEPSGIDPLGMHWLFGAQVPFWHEPVPPMHGVPLAAGPVPMHEPFMHVSEAVHGLPSSHGVPVSGVGGMGHPGPGMQIPGSKHCAAMHCVV
jgi:hypothetical protein